MAAKSKARVIIARLMSTAGTGYFYTTTRLRTADRIVMRKYDPKGESGAAVCWVGSESRGAVSRGLLRRRKQQVIMLCILASLLFTLLRRRITCLWPTRPRDGAR
jgi:large subunit ribosomal protein L33